MQTHNHPGPELIDHLARQLADILRFDYDGIDSSKPDQFNAITLRVFGNLLSPRTVDDLGLNYPADDDWLAQGTAMINDVARAYGLTGGGAN